jgi:hypothetical protein
LVSLRLIGRSPATATGTLPEPDDFKLQGFLALSSPLP